jgi:hypothetical protein
MSKNYDSSIRGGFTMPSSWTGDHAVIVRTSSATATVVDPVPAGIAAVGSERRTDDTAPNHAFTPRNDLFFVKDAFPGPLAWSPPM